MCVGCLGFLLLRRRHVGDVRKAMPLRYHAWCSDPKSIAVVDSQSFTVFPNHVLTMM